MFVGQLYLTPWYMSSGFERGSNSQPLAYCGMVFSPMRSNVKDGRMPHFGARFFL